MPQSIQPTRPNWIEVDSAAIDANYALVRKLLPASVRIHASVKNRAYGLGLVPLAERLIRLGVEALSAGSFSDAVALRRGGIEKTDIVMFAGTLPEGVGQYLEYGLIPTVHNREIAEAVSGAARRRAKVYVKVDCGWGRVGFPIRHAREELLRVARLPNVEIEGLYTHLPFSTIEGLEWARERTAVFQEFVSDLKKHGLEIPITQARSSAGVLMRIEDGCNSVAPGAALYGKQPLPADMHDFAGFQPVLKAVRTRLIHIRHDVSDPTPAMNSRFSDRVKGATGAIPFGRSDGNRSPIAGQASRVLVRGVRVPVLSVSSELAVLDLSDVDNPQVGDEVTIIGQSGGERITLADVAGWQGTGEGDILMMLSDRMQRVDLAAD